jgi:DNA-binding transcriptional LysR family regulator
MEVPTDTLIRRLPRRLKMSELRVFVAVLEHRSFRKAAAVLHLTQPAVTKAIAGLEQMLGVALFDRASDGVVPTAHGLSFAPRAVAVFEELRRAAQELALVSSGERGTLRVGILPMPAIPFLPVAIKRMTEARPDIFVTVFEGREAELLDRLQKRDIEVAILRLALVAPAENMRVERLFDEKLCVIAAREHPLAALKKPTWPQLLRERWVMPPADCYFYEHVLRTLDRAGLPMPKHVIESFSINIQFGMVLHAGMLSFGMRSQVEFAPGKALLVRLPIELPAPTTMVAAVSLRSHSTSPLLKQLVEHIRALAGTDQPGTDAASAAATRLPARSSESSSPSQAHAGVQPALGPSVTRATARPTT